MPLETAYPDSVYIISAGNVSLALKKNHNNESLTIIVNVSICMYT